jgi:transcription antitermination factor NusG
MKWYVLYTRSKCEKKVAATLSKKGIENYCPLNVKLRQWSDRKKIIHEPVFTSYVFVRTIETEIHQIKRVCSDIVSIVYWIGKPAIVKDEEINEIKLFLDEFQEVQLEKKEVSIHDKVRILRGPLMNYEGEVLSVSSNQIKLMLPSLGYMMIAETNKNNVHILDKVSNNIPAHIDIEKEELHLN